MPEEFQYGGLRRLCARPILPEVDCSQRVNSSRKTAAILNPEVLSKYSSTKRYGFFDQPATLSMVAMVVVRAGALVCIQSWYPMTLPKMADHMAKSPIRNSGSLFIAVILEAIQIF